MTERRLPKTAVENLVEDLASKANADLSNLDATGQAKLDAKANTSLSNLDATGQAKFDAKADVSLNNLDAAGQAKFDAKADKNIPVIGIPATSGTVTLADNTVYTGTMVGAMTFVLPTVTDATQYHQIKAMLYLPVVTIDWGTTHYIGGDAPDVSEAGNYMIYWDYVPALSAWAVGAMKVG